MRKHKTHQKPNEKQKTTCKQKKINTYIKVFAINTLQKIVDFFENSEENKSLQSRS